MIFQARILEWVVIRSPWDLPNPGIEPGSSALQADFFFFFFFFTVWAVREDSADDPGKTGHHEAQKTLSVRTRLRDTPVGITELPCGPGGQGWHSWPSWSWFALCARAETELISTKNQNCGSVHSPLGLTQTGWCLFACYSSWTREARKNDSGERMQEQQGAAEMMRCQLNYRQSVQKGGELVHLRIQPRRTVETNKLFWLLRIKSCWWKRQGTEWLGRKARSIKLDPALVPAPLKL